MGKEQAVSKEDSRKRRARGLALSDLIAWRSFTRGNVYIIEQINHDMEQALDLTINEFELLHAVYESPTKSLRMSKIAQDLHHSRSRLTHTARRLEKMGYVERSRCPHDRRGVFCSLTEAGIAKFEESLAEHSSIVHTHLINRLAPEELDELGRIYRKLLGWDETDAIAEYNMAEDQCP